MPSKKIRLTISDLWTNQYTYFIIVGFIVGICAGFSNVIFHWLYNTVNLLFISPLESSNMVIFGTIVGGLILFFISTYQIGTIFLDINFINLFIQFLGVVEL